MNPDPIEAILRNRVPLANKTKLGLINSHPSPGSGYHNSIHRGFSSPTSSTSSSDAPLMAQSSKARAKAAKQEESLANKGGGSALSNTNNNEMIKVEPALESCLGETGTGLAWLQHVLRTKTNKTTSTDSHDSNKQPLPMIQTELSEDGKDILRRLLNSVAIDDEFLNSNAGSTPCWSFLAQRQHQQQPESNAEISAVTPTRVQHSSLFVLILQKVVTNFDTKNENNFEQQPTTIPIKATQLLKSCSPYFEGKYASKNVPPELDSNQVIFAALSFLSSTTIPSLEFDEDMEPPDEQSTSIADPHHHFPLMPLLLSGSPNTPNDEEPNPNLRLYQINEPNLPPSSLHDPHVLAKLLNLEAAFWASSVAYPSRFRVIPRMEDGVRETTLCFTGGSTAKKGETEGSSGKRGKTKGGGGGVKRKLVEGQVVGSEGKVRKKKVSVDATPKV